MNRLKDMQKMLLTFTFGMWQDLCAQTSRRAVANAHYTHTHTLVHDSGDFAAGFGRIMQYLFFKSIFYGR